MELANKKYTVRLEDMDSLWNPLDAPGSESTFRSLLPEVMQVATGGDASLWVLLLTWIARAEAHQKKFNDARGSLEKAQELFKEQEQPLPNSTRIRWLMERGRLHILEKTPSQARAFFSEAWTLALKSGEDHFAVEIAQWMAASEPQKAQQKWIDRAIEIAEGSSQDRCKQFLGVLYSTQGWKLYDLRQFEKSLEFFQKALGSFKERGMEREAFVARWSIGKVLRASGKTEEALVIQKALLSEVGIGGRRDGRLYEELAECLQTLKRTSEAQLYFELAYQELSNDEWVADNQPVQLKRLKDLGKVK